MGVFFVESLVQHQTQTMENMHRTAQLWITIERNGERQFVSMKKTSSN